MLKFPRVPSTPKKYKMFNSDRIIGRDVGNFGENPNIIYEVKIGPKLLREQEKI